MIKQLILGSTIGSKLKVATTLMKIMLSVTGFLCVNSGIPFENTQETVQESNELNDGFTEQELQDMEYVDSRIQYLLDNEEFKSLSLKNKATIALILMRKLESDGYIKNIWYEEGSDIISFEYSCGVLGGIMLKPWDPMLN